ncbi:MAG: diacylglycerol kinase family protein [Bdellovibrionota bacterium]
MAGIAVISNPNSAKNRRNPVLAEELRTALGKDGFVTETASVEKVPEAVRGFLRQNPDVVAINGGDGTLHCTITQLVRIYAEANRQLPLILLLRGGTMNTISKGMKSLAGTPQSILAHVLGKYRRGEKFSVVERHALDLNQGKELGFLFGIGLPPNFLEAYYDGAVHGPIKGAYVLGRLVLSALIGGQYSRRIIRRVPAALSADGKESPYRSYTCILAGTVTEIGLGFSPLARTLDRENHFQILGAAISPWSFAAQVGRIYTGAPLHGAIFNEVAKDVSIEVEGSHPYMVDGDIKKGLGGYRLRAGPKVRFIKE